MLRKAHNGKQRSKFKLSGGGYQLTGTAAYVTNNGRRPRWEDFYGNYYHLEDGNVYMDRQDHLTKYDLSKGWLPVEVRGSKESYIAPGSKDYEKVRKSYYAQKDAEAAKRRVKSEKIAARERNEGYGGKSMRPYELYKLATKQYGVKMPYSRFQSNGVEGLMHETYGNKAVHEALKPYFNPKVNRAGKLYWSSFAS